MKKLTTTKTVITKKTTAFIVVFLIGLMYLAHLGVQINKENKIAEKRAKKEAYEKTKQKKYNPKLDSIRPIAYTMATRYTDRDSVDLRVHYVEGCRWIGKVNGGCSDKDYHTISNCPKCIALFVSLLREH